MGNIFEHGDRVYHRGLKLYGIFVDYAWNSDDECYVDFENQYGDIEQRHVSVNWLEKVQEI